MATVLWFRRDLRLCDNPALSQALASHTDLIPLFIFDENDSRCLGGAQRWWLHHSLEALQHRLKKYGATLLLAQGKSVDVFADLSKKYQLDAVYWNRCDEPHQTRLDNKVQKYLQKQKIKTVITDDYLLSSPAKIKNNAGGTFKVFTPYWRHLNSRIEIKHIFPQPTKIPQQSIPESITLDSLRLLPTQPDWSHGFTTQQAGELAAQTALEDFLQHGLEHYNTHRDRVDLAGTSHLSPYLHFGELSIRQVWYAVQQAKLQHPRLSLGAETYLRQLIWREFAYYLLWHFPTLSHKNFRPAFDKFAWKKNQQLLRAWQHGLTGYPIVDAAMRELWQTGLMHNRLRMIVASFLTKDLLIDWREGEQWFWDTLLDADLANNSLGWQWVAGSGPDAAPYFRIFNPTLQAKKFDPQGHYIRKWLPELAALPDTAIHAPFDAKQSVLAQAGILLGKHYPLPIVEHAQARQYALATYQRLKMS